LCERLRGGMMGRWPGPVGGPIEYVQLGMVVGVVAD